MIFCYKTKGLSETKMASDSEEESAAAASKGGKEDATGSGDESVGGGKDDKATPKGKEEATGSGRPNRKRKSTELFEPEDFSAKKPAKKKVAPATKNTADKSTRQVLFVESSAAKAPAASRAQGSSKAAGSNARQATPKSTTEAAAERKAGSVPPKKAAAPKAGKPTSAEHPANQEFLWIRDEKVKSADARGYIHGRGAPSFMEQKMAKAKQGLIPHPKRDPADSNSSICSGSSDTLCEVKVQLRSGENDKYPDLKWYHLKDGYMFNESTGQKANNLRLMVQVAAGRAGLDVCAQYPNGLTDGWVESFQSSIAKILKDHGGAKFVFTKEGFFATDVSRGLFDGVKMERDLGSKLFGPLSKLLDAVLAYNEDRLEYLQKTQSKWIAQDVVVSANAIYQEAMFYRSNHLIYGGESKHKERAAIRFLLKIDEIKRSVGKSLFFPRSEAEYHKYRHISDAYHNQKRDVYEASKEFQTRVNKELDVPLFTMEERTSDDEVSSEDEEGSEDEETGVV